MCLPSWPLELGMTENSSTSVLGTESGFLGAEFSEKMGVGEDNWSALETSTLECSPMLEGGALESCSGTEHRV